MLINVTQDHIDRGVASSPETCAVSLAIRESYETCHVVGTFESKIMVLIVDKQGDVFSLKMSTPDAVREFLVAFDTKKPVRPFSFKMPLDL